MELPLHHRIRERAYQLWNAAGRVHGQAERHWLAAERDVLAEMPAQLPAAETVVSESSARRKRTRTSVAMQRRKTA
jgi:Protein of unknown function (DUF2934)